MTYLDILQAAVQAESTLTEQILALTSNMPSQRLYHAWNHDEVARLLAGHLDAPFTDRDLTLALFELGWTRHRRWGVEGRHQRYWFPPMDDDS